MELEKGSCSVCLERGKIVKNCDCKQIIGLISEILSDVQLNKTEFEGMVNWIKLCPVCCFKIKSTLKIKNERKHNFEHSNKRCCSNCSEKEDLLKIDGDWRGFQDISTRNTPKEAIICLDCYFYLDVSNNIKEKLTEKFPQLKPVEQLKKISTSDKKSNSKSNKSPINRKSSKRSKSNISPKGVKKVIVPKSLKHVKPLIKCNYKLKEEIKKDVNFFKKIPFINLNKLIKNNSPKPFRPKIKIKLRPSSQSKNYSDNSDNAVSESDETTSKQNSRAGSEEKDSADEFVNQKKFKDCKKIAIRRPLHSKTEEIPIKKPRFSVSFSEEDSIVNKYVDDVNKTQLSDEESLPEENRKSPIKDSDEEHDDKESNPDIPVVNGDEKNDIDKNIFDKQEEETDNQSEQSDKENDHAEHEEDNDELDEQNEQDTNKGSGSEIDEDDSEKQISSNDKMFNDLCNAGELDTTLSDNEPVSEIEKKKKRVSFIDDDI